MELSRIAFAAGLALTVSACATKTKTAAVSPEAKVVAQQNEASYVAEIGFEKGSAQLTPAAKTQLASILDRAKNAGKLDEVKVISWADAEYPSEAAKRLPKAQRDLADRRNTTIKNYLKNVASGVDVDEYNMAERPNSMERLLSTSDARIKRGLENAGIATTAHDLRFPENASKSMVMVILE